MAALGLLNKVLNVRQIGFNNVLDLMYKNHLYFLAEEYSVIDEYLVVCLDELECVVLKTQILAFSQRTKLHFLEMKILLLS